MAALAKLAKLALVNKVSKELENHLGVADKTLSEFVISLAEESADAEGFKTALAGVGAEVDDAFAESLLGLIRRGRKRKTIGGGVEGDSGKTSEGARSASVTDAQFPGLTVRDDESHAKALTRELYGDGDASANAADDPRLSARGREREASHSRASVQTHARPDAPTLDGEPNVGEVYRGRVTNVMDFGAFVQLVDFKRKAEGLVHVSTIADRHLKSAKDGASRGESVFVKVMNRNGNKLSLSMKAVDQTTGKECAGAAAKSTFGTGRSNPAPRNLPPPAPRESLRSKVCRGSTRARSRTRTRGRVNVRRRD